MATFLHADHVTVLADRGLSALPLIRLCQRHHWHYLLRIQNDEYCRRRRRRGYRDWQRGCDFLLKAGTSWYGEVLLWKSHGFSCHLAAYWDPDYKEAWFVISDLPASPRRVESVWAAHAGGSHLPRYQDSSLVHREESIAR